MGGRQLALVNNTGQLNLREVAARATLRETRLKGHVYVELRQVGKRTIFFCTLCQTPCFNDSVLSDHLNGHFHSRRLASAKITLFGPTPWPFSDGVLFFDTSCGEETESATFGCVGNGRKNNNKASKVKGKGNCLVIPGVLNKEGVGSMRAKFLGYGHVGARVVETSEGRRSISRIWCAWLGQGGSEDWNEMMLSPKCEFAIVSFAYTYDLGRKAGSDEMESPRSSGSSDSLGSFFEIDDLGRPRKKKRKSFSDPEDFSDGRADRRNVCEEDAASLLHSRSARRELRKQKRLTAERTCDICGQLMLPGKDVSTLLNRKTGKLACSSRNVNGAFHLFHTSCLIHWILLCEFEKWSSQPTNIKVTTRGRKAKTPQKNCIPIFCPECQGTGAHIEGDELEKPVYPLSEIFLHKLKVIEAHKTWMKYPEDLKKCSTGLHFALSDTEKHQVQEKVIPLKLLQFYRADE